MIWSFAIKWAIHESIFSCTVFPNFIFLLLLLQRFSLFPSLMKRTHTQRNWFLIYLNWLIFCLSIFAFNLGSKIVATGSGGDLFEQTHQFTFVWNWHEIDVRTTGLYRSRDRAGPSIVARDRSTAGHHFQVQNIDFALQFDFARLIELCLLTISGESGSGKSHQCQQTLRRLLRLGKVSTGSELDRHVNAAQQVLRSMGTASTLSNPHSNRLVSSSCNLLRRICSYCDQRKRRSFVAFWPRFAKFVLSPLPSFTDSVFILI